ncbi:hypothetical protein [Stenotrophomonas pavanii]
MDPEEPLEIAKSMSRGRIVTQHRIGEALEKAAVVSFLNEGALAHDLATLLDLARRDRAIHDRIDHGAQVAGMRIRRSQGRARTPRETVAFLFSATTCSAMPHDDQE